MLCDGEVEGLGCVELWKGSRSKLIARFDSLPPSNPPDDLQHEASHKALFSSTISGLGFSAVAIERAF
jgi:hypothetical protein